MYFTEGKIKRILVELSDCRYSDAENIQSYKMKEGNFNGGEQVDLDTSAWREFTSQDRWGGKSKHFWFRTEVTIPERFEGKNVVYEVKTGKEGDWDATNPQFIIYVNGKLIQGLDVNHREVVLSDRAQSGDKYAIALHSYSGVNEGLVELKTRIAVQESKVEKLYYDIKVPYEVALLLDKEDKRRIDILGLLDEAVNMIDLRKPFSRDFFESVEKADTYLDKEFYKKYCGVEDVTATCVGHTHIDVAWLWTLAQTREKTTRSFSTVLNLMKDYPEYVFMSSQPQLYKFIKEDHPEIYEEIRKKVKEGRWEPEGAMWLEADCNLSSGESFVRQILFGTRFFEKEFGIKNKILWLPDVFGYSAALPQILKKSGIDYFMTTKISWSEYNRMPYDSFVWRGIDGSEVLTHFITTGDTMPDLTAPYSTYNGSITPYKVASAWDRYQQKNINNDVLVSFGYGDGGGGPTKEMLENARRLEKGIPGCPKVKIGKAGDFFKRLEDKVKDNKKLPRWVGELYLELHRGTYTSMGRNKKYNRKSEFLYQDAELLSVMSEASAGCGNYPQEKLNEGWETILLNQFHDILPGSSVKEVYEDSHKDYERVLGDGRKIVDNAMNSIAAQIDLNETSILVFNQLSFVRNDIVEFDLPEGYDGVEISDCDGKVIQSQIVCDSKDRNRKKVIFIAESVPAKGYRAFRLKKASESVACCTCCNDCVPYADKDMLRNRFFDIKLDRGCNIVSIYDKVNKREVLKEGLKANVLQAFEDKPYSFDAWEISIFYQDKMWEITEAESVDVVDAGPVRATIRVGRRFLDSTIKQDIHIYNDLPRIDFATTIDWKEKQVLLKAAFPVDVHTDKATYEIQYGNVERPTHWNTSWDYARFEVCAHKWADLSEGGYGVSLLNDCKYGHDTKDGVMRLTLLKSAASPYPEADKEIHEFTYSLYPHGGDWKEAGTVQMAYALNCPMYVKIENAHDGSLPSELSMIKLDRDNVVIEVVKKAEDSDDIIVRMYECHNRRTSVQLTFFRDIAKVWECDLMENNIKQLDVDGSSFEFEIQPYEIKTFKLRV